MIGKDEALAMIFLPPYYSLKLTAIEECLRWAVKYRACSLKGGKGEGAGDINSELSLYFSKSLPEK